MSVTEVRIFAAGFVAVFAAGLVVIALVSWRMTKRDEALILKLRKRVSP